MSLANGRLEAYATDLLDRIVQVSPPGEPRALAWLLRSIGCRLGEALGISGADVGADEVRIPWLKHRGRARWRTLPLPRARLTLATLLRQGGLDLAGHAETSPPVFGITARTAQRWARAAAQACGIAGFHPHDFRHGFACDWLSRGGDLVRLQHWLGHSSLATTALYLHSTPADLRREAERIGLAGAPLLPQGALPPIGDHLDLVHHG